MTVTAPVDAVATAAGVSSSLRFTWCICSLICALVVAWPRNSSVWGIVFYVGNMSSDRWTVSVEGSGSDERISVHQLFVVFKKKQVQSIRSWKTKTRSVKSEILWILWYIFRLFDAFLRKTPSASSRCQGAPSPSMMEPATRRNWATTCSTP